jgi:hypothetical protein
MCPCLPVAGAAQALREQGAYYLQVTSLLMNKQGKQAPTTHTDKTQKAARAAH